MNQPEAMNGVDPVDESEAPQLPSLPVRALNVFFAPSDLMAGLRSHPAWVGAVALGSILTVLSAILLPTEIFEVSMRQRLLESGGEVPDNLERMAGFFRIGGAVAGFVFWWVIAAIMAGLVTLIFSFGLGDRGTYRQYLAVLAHAFLISAVGALAVLPLRISAQDASMLLSVGTFMPFLEDGYPARALRLLDLFGLWSWAVVGIGVAVLEPKRTVGSAIAIVMAIPVAMALIFGIFGG
ncbi:MAG: hypothetical protein BMS9Abin29_1389 [Gemmatimonadota bacterium]|nr:MAG: hypothetical protein BMS9Abin29_1389 [Gemmatimonadota bacterium]